VAAGVAPRLKVIADENGIEADLLGGATELQKVARTELVRRCFVAKFDHDILLVLLSLARFRPRTP
jgi:hypothetical protein